jgi:hypothetical protein
VTRFERENGIDASYCIGHLVSNTWNHKESRTDPAHWEGTWNKGSECRTGADCSKKSMTSAGHHKGSMTSYGYNKENVTYSYYVLMNIAASDCGPFDKESSWVIAEESSSNFDGVLYEQKVTKENKTQTYKTN